MSWEVGAEAAKRERSAASAARSLWYVIDTVHAPLHASDNWGATPGDVLWVNAVYAADEPGFGFHDPKNYPRLGKAIVEMANRRHRKAHRVYERTALAYDWAYWRSLEDEERTAEMRMAIHRQSPWNTGGILLPRIGGWIESDMPAPSGDANTDWIGEMVVDLARLRLAKDYETADALKREITLGAGARIYMSKDGIEFLDAKHWG